MEAGARLEVRQVAAVVAHAHQVAEVAAEVAPAAHGLLVVAVAVDRAAHGLLPVEVVVEAELPAAHVLLAEAAEAAVRRQGQAGQAASFLPHRAHRRGP